MIHRAKLWSWVLAGAVGSLASTSNAAYLTNGDFETSNTEATPPETSAPFASWNENPAGAVSDYTASPISGDHSAKLTRATSGSLLQTAQNASELTNYIFSVDLALQAPTNGADRTFQLLLHHSGSPQPNLNIRVIDSDQNGVGELQVYGAGGSAAFTTVFANAVVFSTDADDNGDFAGENDTQAVNRITVTADYRSAIGYTVSLSNSLGSPTSATLAGFQSGTAGAITPGTVGMNLVSVDFQTGNMQAGRFAIVDNVTLTLVPEPASLALLGLGGVLCLRRRR